MKKVQIQEVEKSPRTWLNSTMQSIVYNGYLLTTHSTMESTFSHSHETFNNTDHILTLGHKTN